MAPLSTALAERPALDLAVVSPPQDPIPEAAHGNNPWPVTLGDLNATIAQLGLPDDHAAALRWLRDFGFRNRRGIADVAELIGYNRNTLYKIMTGRHGASLASFTKEVEAFRAKVDKSATKDFPFTLTETGERINTICDLAISSGRIALLVGRSHCGKTVNLTEYPKRHPYGKVNTVRMNAGGQAHQFKMRLAITKAVSNAYRAGDLSERLIEVLKEDRALIVDEFQECAPDGEKPRQKTIGYIREIHDLTGIPIVLAMHEEAFDRMQEKRHAQLFKPLLNRALDPFYLPAEPTEGDRNAYAAQLGLPAAGGHALDLQATTITTKSLGSWLTLLLRGQAVAKNRQEKFIWEHVLKADRLLAKEGRGK